MSWAEHYTCMANSARKQAEAYDLEARAAAVCPDGDPNYMERHCLRMARSCRERAGLYDALAKDEPRERAA